MTYSSASDFRRFLEQPIVLPALPQTVLTLVTKASDRRAGPPILLEAAGWDPVVVAVLLKVLSSTASGYQEPSRSIQQALDLTDQGLLSEALLSLRIETGNSRAGLQLDSFRKHGIGCAVISELLATRLGYPVPGDAFLAGLIHDLGKIILCVWNPSSFDAVWEQSQARQLPSLPLEEAVLGIGHTVAGRLLMEQWNFPAFLAAVCDLHHQPFSKLPEYDQMTALPAIVQQADRLCHLWGFGGRASLTEPEVLELGELTRLSADDFCALYIQASGRVQLAGGSIRSGSEATEAAVLEALWRRLAEVHSAVSDKNRELRLEARILSGGVRMLRALGQRPSLERTKRVIALELGDCFRGRRLVVRFQSAGSAAVECWARQHPDDSMKPSPSGPVLPQVDADGKAQNLVCLPIQHEGEVFGHVFVDLLPDELRGSLGPLLDCLSVGSRLLATTAALESGGARGLEGQSEEEPATGLSPESSGAAAATSRQASRSTGAECGPDQKLIKNSAMVLVVEDDQVLRRLLIEILTRAGYEADGAEDGLVAIRKLIEGRYLAAILDLQMPHIDGLEVLVTSRRIAPDMPIIVLTGVVGPRGIDAARDAGAFRCLRKPASNDEILRAVSQALASRGAGAAEHEREASA